MPGFNAQWNCKLRPKTYNQDTGILLNFIKSGKITPFRQSNISWNKKLSSLEIIGFKAPGSSYRLWIYWLVWRQPANWCQSWKQKYRRPNSTPAPSLVLAQLVSVERYPHCLSIRNHPRYFHRWHSAAVTFRKTNHGWLWRQKMCKHCSSVCMVSPSRACYLTVCLVSDMH